MLPYLTPLFESIKTPDMDKAIVGPQHIAQYLSAMVANYIVIQTRKEKKDQDST